ncbi:MAG: bifunctional 5,10-methylenetetrahydrofolate dehydrogenase/5,10-methenyltetrahydrofolate cyclohydrolase [Candidatus Taylorbacteria bacterium]|nr:bifunctional 5,10-methylenetetrahydrofolate dehydrogenase/5,10-methenyltetrahydrofolate cyclohydrolase [Candidatus Taylorbacteria bacterium]
MILIDGRKAREHYMPILCDKIKALSTIPQLVIIQVGSRADSDAFIKAKKSFALKIGVKEVHVQLDQKVSEKEVIKVIKKYNKDKSIQGIIVQLPLPSHLNPDTIINNIDLKKDVDGLTPETLFMPATARGISELLDFYKISLKNKKVAMLGRSKLVGTPIAEMCRKKGAHVTVCHKETKNIPEITKKADIIIVAIGQPKFIDEKYLSKNQIVIDVGITRDLEEGLVGDVDFEKVKNTVAMISPVPGGVGQMTVLALFENLIDAC